MTLEELAVINHRHRSNLSREEHSTLKQLRNKSLVLLPSDKGGEFCCLSEDQYQRAANEHLSDQTYRQVRTIKVDTVERRLNHIHSIFIVLCI